MASLLLLAMLACATTLASNAAGVRVGLTRIHSNLDIRRARFLASSSVAAPLSVGNAEFVMTLAIGTPPLAYQAIADTGSDLIWTRCAPCVSRCSNQPTPLYDPASSSTFSVLPCNSSLSRCTAAPCPSSRCAYNQSYGTGWTSGIQAVEKFTFGSTPAVPGVAFGCSTATSADFDGAAGIVGLGRGGQSLVSQLGAGRFSYCLTTYDDANSTSTLFLGPSAVLNDAGVVKSTPFVPSPSKYPMSSYYFLNLTGISLGATMLPIPPAAFLLGADGTGGVIIDSGTTFTSLVDAAYQPVREAVKDHLALPLVTGMVLDLCSSTPPAKLPSMTFHFDGAEMVLPPDNYMSLDQDSGVWCLAMASYEGISIFGNYQQQNMHILYDVHNEILSFAPADCGTL